MAPRGAGAALLCCCLAACLLGAPAEESQPAGIRLDKSVVQDKEYVRGRAAGGRLLALPGAGEPSAQLALAVP